MWDRKKEQPATRPGSQSAQNGHSATAVMNPPAPAATAAAPAYRAPEPLTPASKSTAIGAGVKIVGDVYSEEDLFVDGEVHGSLDIKDSKLTIGPRGKAKSNVRAREVVIHGQVHGDVEASQKITIRKDGSLVGNIKTTGIVIDDDAYFKGSIDIVRKDSDPTA